MTTLVVGATGKTGRLLVEQLLARGEGVRTIVRSPDKPSDTLRENPLLSVVHGNVLDMSDEDLCRHVNGCSAVASCLGHNMNWRGVYGAPRRLVADTTRRLCDAITAGSPEHPVRFVLMNTAGNSNRDINEPVSFSERCVIGTIRLLLPPHADNEEAADYLRTHVGQNDRTIEWAVVRPDSLVNEEHITDYEVHPSPTRSAIFNAGETSRINVAHFMADLVTDLDPWPRWKGQMPVIYNKTAS